LNKYTLADLRDPLFESRKKGVEVKTPEELGKEEDKDNEPQETPWKIAANKAQKMLTVNENSGDMPSNLLELEYIHGYRCHDTRNNISYNAKGQLIYHAAQVGIQLDTNVNQMKFIMQNQDDIMCLESHNEFTATGDIGEQPVLCIWNNLAMTPVADLALTAFKRGIGLVTFSHDGTEIAVSCLDVERTIVILDFNKIREGATDGSFRLSQTP
jgi:hypothetical protein